MASLQPGATPWYAKDVSALGLMSKAAPYLAGAMAVREGIDTGLAASQNVRMGLISDISSLVFKANAPLTNEIIKKLPFGGETLSNWLNNEPEAFHRAYKQQMSIFESVVAPTQASLARLAAVGGTGALKGALNTGYGYTISEASGLMEQYLRSSGRTDIDEKESDLVSKWSRLGVGPGSLGALTRMTTAGGGTPGGDPLAVVRTFTGLAEKMGVGQGRLEEFLGRIAGNTNMLAERGIRLDPGTISSSMASLSGHASFQGMAGVAGYSSAQGTVHGAQQQALGMFLPPGLSRLLLIVNAYRQGGGVMGMLKTLEAQQQAPHKAISGSTAGTSGLLRQLLSIEAYGGNVTQGLDALSPAGGASTDYGIYGTSYEGKLGSVANFLQMQERTSYLNRQQYRSALKGHDLSKRQDILPEDQLDLGFVDSSYRLRNAELMLSQGMAREGAQYLTSESIAERLGEAFARAVMSITPFNAWSDTAKGSEAPKPVLQHQDQE